MPPASASVYLLPWAPVTGPHLGQGRLSIAVLAQAAQEMSDGVAANLLVKRLGGPAAVSAKWRVVIAAYFDSGEYTAQVEARHEAVLAEVGRIAAGWAALHARDAKPR